MATIDDVASRIVAEFPTPISTMKLQKLCYIAQGWSLALRGEELFENDFEAWRNGPVSYDLFVRHKGQYSISEWEWGDPERLNDLENLVVSAVLQNYGALSGLQLSELTHKPNTPWSETRALVGATEGSSSSAVISKARIRAHFAEILRV